MHAHVENRDGVLYIPGTRISLDSIVYAFRQGASPESIREDFNGLSLADVYGAITYYLDNQCQVDAYLGRRNEQWAQLEKQAVPLGEELRLRLDRARQRA